MKVKVNEIKIIYQQKYPVKDAVVIKASTVAAEVFIENWNQDTININETFKLMLLNNSNKVKGIFELSKGGITGTLVDVRILFAIVLKTLSTAIILGHNHPSGNLKPSESDKKLTQKIKKASEMFDVKLLDHIIISPYGDYFSFADEGVL